MRVCALLLLWVTARASVVEDVSSGRRRRGIGITDATLRKVSEELYMLDIHNVASYISIDMQGITTKSDKDDVAPNPLYTFVAPEALAVETVVLLETLRDNYNLEESDPEDDTPAEQAEVAAFLDAVMATPLMARLELFMAEQELLNGTLRANIQHAWFTLYSRSGSVLGSSGFEHVFMGELNNGANVGGLHNWVTFYRQEAAGNLNYMGYIEYSDLKEAGYVLTSRFTFYGDHKPIGGGFVGTSPEFELAIFTLCFYARPNSLCPVQTNGVLYNIQTYDMDGKPLVASAYPIVLK